MSPARTRPLVLVARPLAVEWRPLGLGVRAGAEWAGRPLRSEGCAAGRLGARVTPISSARNVAVVPPPQLLQAGSDHQAEGYARGEHGNAGSEQERASHWDTGSERQQRRSD